MGLKRYHRDGSMRIDGRPLVFVVLAGCGIDAIGSLAAEGDGGANVVAGPDWFLF
jgi:hypothetical protein